ncbi:hypothetical protein HJG60_008522 [Phyllostomus discolor]|uniref:Uncharacterized protein n=1 Tax=Phyllostomus discolor TaxID=89673 RepID=A0A833Z4U1_9CHIR|nr:hypothetical protein HJG60_008522 [Phyllostomus discolor]
MHHSLGFRPCTPPAPCRPAAFCRRWGCFPPFLLPAPLLFFPSESHMLRVWGPRPWGAPSCSVRFQILLPAPLSLCGLVPVTGKDVASEPQPVPSWLLPRPRCAVGTAASHRGAAGLPGERQAVIGSQELPLPSGCRETDGNRGDLSAKPLVRPPRARGSGPPSLLLLCFP